MDECSLLMLMTRVLVGWCCPTSRVEARDMSRSRVSVTVLCSRKVGFQTRQHESSDPDCHDLQATNNRCDETGMDSIILHSSPAISIMTGLPILYGQAQNELMGYSNNTLARSLLYVEDQWVGPMMRVPSRIITISSGCH